MAVKFKQSPHGKPTYALVAETPSEDDIKLAKYNIRDARETSKGHNKTKSMKLLMEIPKEILYNYLVVKGVPVRKHNLWLKDKRNVSQLCKDFPMFSV